MKFSSLKTAFSFVLRYPKIILFTFFFLSAFLPKLLVPGFATADDPYYHVTQAHMYSSEQTLTYPEFSDFIRYEADLWWLYHITMSWFTSSDPDVDTQSLILSSKFYHSLCAAFFFVIFFAVTRRYLEVVRDSKFYSSLRIGELPSVNPTSLSLFAVVTLFLFANDFTIRILVFERPHILIIAFTLIAFLAIIDRKPLVIFLCGVLAALTYSFSVFVLLPALGLLLAWLCLERNQATFKTAIMPLFLGILGLGVGAWLHPDSYGYFHNGFLMISFAIFQTLFGWALADLRTLTMPAEMLFLYDPPTLFLMFVLFVLMFVYVFAIKRKSSIELSYDERHGKLLLFTPFGIGIIFILIQIFIPRAIEYSVPFSFMAIAGIVGYVVYPYLKTQHQTLSHKAGEIADYYRKLIAGLLEIGQDERFQKLVATCVALAVLLGPIFFATNILVDYKHDPNYYQAAATYLKTEPGALVLTASFDLYPQLIFHNHTTKYTSGFDPRFMFTYNQELALTIDKLWAIKPECLGYYYCPKEALPLDYFEYLKSFGVTHVLINEKNTPPYVVERITQNSNFSLTFTDEQKPYIKIYKLQQ